MTALASQRPNEPRAMTRFRVPLAVNTAAYKGGAAGIETASNANQGKVVPMSVSTSLVYIGHFAENVSASASAQNVNIDLQKEVFAYWYVNSASPNAVAATDVGSVCYFVDDQTVSISGTGNSLAGRVWAVDSTKGVLVEKLVGSTTVAATNIAASGVAAGTAYQVLRTNSAGTASEWGTPLAPPPASDLAAFQSNNAAPATLVSGRTYSIPATAAASTVTLPAAAADGTIVYFVADGTNNGHTVQYRDATGPTNITTALTANVRHLVVAIKRGTAWYANAYVSP